MDHWIIQNTFSEFYPAIDNHEVDEVRRLLRTRKFPINGNYCYRDHPIIECMESCRGREDEPKTLEILKLLVQHGADVNVRSFYRYPRRMTAAMIAADLGLDSCLRFLVESGTDLTIRADSGDNTLMIAARSGRVDSVKYLIEDGKMSSLNQVNNQGQTALMMAASGSNDAHGLCVKFLVEAGADLNVQDRFEITALMLAAEAGGFNSVKYLTERISVSRLNQTNYDGVTALMMAASNNSSEHTSCLKCLVEAGADMNVQDKDGYTALIYASGGGNAESVKFLTDGMSVSTLNQANAHGKTALMLAASRYSTDNVDILKYLVEAGADVNIQCKDGYTALMYATILGKVENVKFLTERMSVSTLNQVNDQGQTALMLAASRYGTDNADILKYIVEAGADMNVQCKRGYTALMKVASRNDHTESHLEYLITAGADLNVADTETGYTALMIALDLGNDRVVSLLLEKGGALVNIVTPDLKSPLSLQPGRNILMITKLLFHGLDPALSYRDQKILHTMVVKGEKSLVRGLVMNGFPPVDVKSTKSPRVSNRVLLPSADTPVSPLALALASKRHEIARYLIVNRFFTRYDLVQLCRNQKLRQYLQRKPECLEILDYLSARPHSLCDLCLVTVSSALSQYLVHDRRHIPPGDSRWMCKPTFRERVDLLQLPPALKRELLHDTPSSSISCESWGNIPLE